MVVKNLHLVFSLDLFTSILHPVVYMPKLSVGLTNYFPFHVFTLQFYVFQNSNYIRI